MTKEDRFLKVISVLKSCKTKDQRESGQKWALNQAKMFGFSRNEILEVEKQYHIITR